MKYADIVSAFKDETSPICRTTVWLATVCPRTFWAIVSWHMFYVARCSGLNRGHKKRIMELVSEIDELMERAVDDRTESFDELSL